jgi:hypothetical protein
VELEHAKLAPKAQPCGGTEGEEPEVGRGWPLSRWSPAVRKEEAGSYRAEKQVTEGEKVASAPRVCEVASRLHVCEEREVVAATSLG